MNRRTFILASIAACLPVSNAVAARAAYDEKIGRCMTTMAKGADRSMELVRRNGRLITEAAIRTTERANQWAQA